MDTRPAWKMGGAWLKGLRLSAEITENELAEQTGAHSGAWIEKIEAGELAIPPASHKAFARTFALPAKDFAERCLAYYGTGNGAIGKAA